VPQYVSYTKPLSSYKYKGYIGLWRNTKDT
jgi:hypothetical protein